jgi:hypothetical protein
LLDVDYFALELIEREFATDDFEDIKSLFSAKQHDVDGIVSGRSLAKRDIPTDQDTVARFTA